MLWQAHSAEIEIHSVALGRIFKTPRVPARDMKIYSNVGFVCFSVLFLPTNCVHRQYRPIDVRVPKG